MGLSCGGGAQLGGTRKRWGAGTLVLRAVCAAVSEAGRKGRKEVCLEPLKTVRKQDPSSPDLPLREDQDRSKGSRLIPYWLQS